MIAASSPSAALTKPVSPAFFVGLWGGVLLLNGILYHTYDITLASPGLETWRQLGVTFLATECAVIICAMRRGLSFANIWATLSKPVKLGLSLFLATFWISSVFLSAIPAFAIMMCFATLVHLAFLASVTHLVDLADDCSFDQMGRLLTGGAVVFSLAIVAKMTFVSQADLAIIDLNGWQFSIPGFISVRMFGATCGALLSFAIARAIMAARSGRAMGWRYFAVTLFTAMTVWTATRAALLGSVVAVFVMLVLLRPRTSRKSALALVICVLFGSFLASLLGPYSDGTFRIVASGDLASADNLTGGRLSLWKSTFDAFLQSPLLGWGAAANRWALAPPFYPHVQPHSFVLQFLINWGAVAALAAFMLLGIAIWKAHRIAMRKPFVAPVLAMLDCLLVMAFFDGILYFSGELMLVAICFGIIFKAGQTNGVAVLDH